MAEPGSEVASHGDENVTAVESFLPDSVLSIPASCCKRFHIGGSLSDDVWALVADNLLKDDIKALARLGKTCRQLRRVVHKSGLWASLLAILLPGARVAKDNRSAVLEDGSQLSYDRCEETVEAIGLVLSPRIFRLAIATGGVWEENDGSPVGHSRSVLQWALDRDPLHDGDEHLRGGVRRGLLESWRRRRRLQIDLLARRRRFRFLFSDSSNNSRFRLRRRTYELLTSGMEDEYEQIQRFRKQVWKQGGCVWTPLEPKSKYIPYEVESAEAKLKGLLTFKVPDPHPLFHCFPRNYYRVP